MITHKSIGVLLAFLAGIPAISFAGPFGLCGRYADCPRSQYSPFIILTPTLHRLHTQKYGKSLIPEQQAVSREAHTPFTYPCPTTEPNTLFLNTNHPYDPNGPLAVTPQQPENP
jgi:hypothetical protein